MAKSKDNNYFEIFVDLIEYSCKASIFLEETIRNFDDKDLENKMKLMHEIEHSADIKGHETINKLLKEFITPIEREDIVELIHEIDNITDSIEDVLMNIYMHNIRSMKEDAIEFSKLIMKSCDEVKKTIEEFKSFKKSKNLHNFIVSVNQLEEEGDRLYTKAIRKLYTEVKDPIEIMSWTKIFNTMEKCCDSFESVVNVIESVVMKNS